MELPQTAQHIINYCVILGSPKEVNFAYPITPMKPHRIGLNSWRASHDLLTHTQEER